MRFFTEHPATVGESYFDHLRVAVGFGAAMIAGGIACLVHGLIPNLFTRTGSNAVRKLHERMVEKRQGKPKIHSDLDLDHVT